MMMEKRNQGSIYKSRLIKMEMKMDKSIGILPGYSHKFDEEEDLRFRF